MLDSSYTYFKRFLDLFFSVIMIVLLSPVLLLISLIIKISGGGPVLFKQERLGVNGVPFKIYKFRSMQTHAPSIAAREIDNDEYVTVIGRILRRTSLDELPQLINILKGEMSFVGPRPFILNEGEINNQRKKHGIDKLRPGLTGWAQVVARDTCDHDEKLKLDLYYLNNVSFFLDMKIVLYTFFSLNGK
ncbi:sugar transferase [Proteiniclasticum sp. SCR006]|uniref:Sugar transferase n=1 Tax=Proteiniclasticum aestuarii TaxID=2817862 RepID=A0A939KII2_9CLOT|nr:sugar transferase [Proteiniclasticum aestuarii]MBO1264001.1 sugar transferase [Proteiniclasticum aestuarii]